MWQPLFAATNIVAVVGWLFLLIGSGQRRIDAARFLAVGALCAVYAILFVLLIAGSVEPGRAPGAPPAPLSDYSVRGLRALFSSDGAIVVGWTHYLAFDLFVGAWITEDAARQEVSRWRLVPILLATFMAGPLGLILYYLLTAKRRLSR
jgi:Mn2+/Fe2+ NRAMP family transporter